ncbi:hypothetical protein ACFWU5_11755 [Nocardia sp. NPDC058640]
MDDALQYLSDNYNAVANLGLYVVHTTIELTLPLTTLILNFLAS